MTKNKFDLVVVIPVGPNVDAEFVYDSIESVYFYCRCSTKIIVSDDSRQGIGTLIKRKFPDIDILLTPKIRGAKVGYGGLYITLSLAYKFAIDNYTFKSLLKLDTDALVIGINPQKDAEEMCDNNPQIGVAGMYKIGKEIVDFNNNVVDNNWPRQHLIRATCTWRIIKRPIGNLTLRKYFFKALSNGYELGENIFGGSYFMNKTLLVEMNKKGLLPLNSLHNSRLGEDHLFSMLAKFLKFSLGDLASGNLTFGVAWKGLPAAPEDLIKREKKIIHSTRFWKNLSETDIRDYFKKIRKSEGMVEPIISESLEVN